MILKDNAGVVRASADGPESENKMRRGIERLANVMTAGAALLLSVMPGAGAAAVSAPPTLSLDVAAERYRPQLTTAIEQCLTDAKSMRAHMLANELEGAQRAWIASRVGWERAEVFTSGFTSELDAEIDAWPSAVSGFHFIEARLFGAHRADAIAATDALIFHLTDLRLKVRDTHLTGQGMLEGAAKLAYEIGESKADGGESRFSGTSIDDMRNNVDGIEAAYRLVFAAALEARDPSLAQALRTKITELRSQLQAANLAAVDGDQVRRTSEELVLSFQRAAPALDLERPSLSDLAQQ
jgi:iron uptake system component EfeO